MGEPLSAPYVLEFTYTRSTGPVIGRFLTGLRDGRIEGVKSASGRVLCPPTEYDTDGSAVTDEWVQVGPGGTVQSFTWVTKPVEGHPLDRPFAFALVRLDGADTSWLHILDAGEESAVSTGMRVVPRWADERTGMVTDLVFVPEDSDE